MQTVIHRLLGRAARQFVDDLRSDPYLKYILLGATLLCGFWFWHRIPNFATRDEHSRLIDVLVAFGTFLGDPGVESLREGVVWSRVPFGATFYLFGLAILPAIFVAALTGQLDLFLQFRNPSWEFGFYASWAATPEWVWTLSIGFVRLFNVAFAVGAVYLTYRIGVASRDRATGRLAAVVLSLTFGFLTIAHEGGEDMPAAFLLLVAVYCCLRYVQDGERTLFYVASALGGLAIAFKLTMAPVVLIIGLAHVLRTVETDADWLDALVQPRLLVAGASLGLAAILLGFPTALVGRLDLVITRIFAGSTGRMAHATGPDAPIWWWFLRGYSSALGLPLLVGAAGGIAASVVHLARRPADWTASIFILSGFGVFVLLFSGWHDFRVHHLLPTFPFIVLLLAASLERLRASRPSVARPLVAVLLLTTAIYAGVGTVGYASMPRDQATDWLQDNAADNATMETYRRNMQDAAVPHGTSINHRFGSDDDDSIDACPEYIQLGYRDLLYMKEGTYYRNGPRQKQYIRSLLNGNDNYAIVAEFGPRPPNFVPQRPTPGSAVDALRLGLVPHTDQYADEQELAENQYTVILERTSDCERPRQPPF